MASRSIHVPLTDASLVGDARRLALELARRAHLDEARKARVGLIVTESASNALRHGQNARILLRALADDEGGGVEVLAVDSGRGMADTQRCLEDGYSTAGSSGTGLGAIKRLSDLFEVYSQVNFGTVLMAQVWRRSDLKPVSRMELGAVCVPRIDEEACGDVWTHQSRPHSEVYMVADGLGHGPMAAQAADEAARVFELSRESHPQGILETAHGPLRATRGASIAVSELVLEKNILRYAGVGNISGRVWTNGSSRSLISHDGTIGHQLHHVREFEYPWPRGSVLVLHSDGLQARWELNRYPGLVLHHPAVMAGILFRDFQRGRDDVTVLVARNRQKPA